MVEFCNEEDSLWLQYQKECSLDLREWSLELWFFSPPSKNPKKGKEGEEEY